MPYWPFPRNCSCLLDFKGIILTNLKELFLKWPVLLGFSDNLDLRERLQQTFKNCCPVWPFLKSFSSLLVLRERLWQTPKNCFCLKSKWALLRDFYNLLDLRERFWQTLKNLCPHCTFLRGFSNLLVLRDIIVAQSAINWCFFRFKGCWQTFQNAIEVHMSNFLKWF